MRTKEQFIEQWKQNILFIKERIDIQNTEGYTPFKLVRTGTRQISQRKTEPEYLEIRETQYTQFDIDREQEKINKAKELWLTT